MAHDFENAIHRIAPPDDLLLPFLDMLLQRSAQREASPCSGGLSSASSASSSHGEPSLRIDT